MSTKWFKLFCAKEELQLKGTLNGGQSFRWSKVCEENEEKWIGVVERNVFIMKQNDDHISYQVYTNPTTATSSEEEYNNYLKKYFQLNLNLKHCFSEWSSKDPIFKKAATEFYGIRILHQDLVENIFSFICSSNNNISRITGMVDKLCSLYGERICEIGDKTYYSFPDFTALAGPQVEETLKKESFGYRAKYINQSAKFIAQNGGHAWLDHLKTLPYKDSKETLMRLTGVGPKVADCICLMSLRHLGTIPVDTHVYQIARNFYLPSLRKQKTVTASVYNEIGDHFRKLYGEYAGWAHTVLFCADLKKFQTNETSTMKS